MAPITARSPPAIVPMPRPAGLPMVRVSLISPTPTARSTFVGWIPAKPLASPIWRKVPTPSPGLPTAKCSPSLPWFSAKARISPIFPRRLPAQNGPSPPPPTTAWSIASMAAAISSPLHASVCGLRRWRRTAASHQRKFPQRRQRVRPHARLLVARWQIPIRLRQPPPRIRS